VEFTLDLALVRRILSEERRQARATRNIKCALLQESRCSIYSVRPQSCRNYHATDVAGCRRSYEEPANLDIDPDFAPSVYQTGAPAIRSRIRAVRRAGRR
jgi:Fe-S-cluster containining protein